MTAAIIDLADAVVAELNTGSFSQSLTARRFYQPVFDLAEMKTLHVSVVPKGVEIEAVSRSQVQQDVQVDIGVQKKLTTADAAEIDPLMLLVEEIAAFFQLRRLSGVNAVWVKTENSPIYAPEHLEQLRQFTSVITLTFRMVK